ncbi:MAG: LVIVD repeat-containing protein [Anaerolineae bacterium]
MPSASNAVVAFHGPAGGIAVLGDKVYLAEGAHLAVVDVSTPSAPSVNSLIGPLDDRCVITDVDADGEHVYASCLDEHATFDSEGTKTTVFVLSAATDSRPAELTGSLELDEWAMRLTASGRWVYSGGIWCSPGTDCAGERRGGMVVNDARVPTAPETVGFVDLADSLVFAAMVDDGFLYAAGSRPVDVVDGPSFVGILDLKLPQAPALVAAIDADALGPDAGAWGLARHDGLLYVLPGPYVFDTRDPTQPTLLATMRFGSIHTPWAIESSGEYLYVLGEIDEPHRFQVTEPLDLGTVPGSDVDATIVGELTLPEPVVLEPWDDALAVSDGYAFVARADSGGLYVIDARDPAAPRVVGALGN